MKSNYKSISDEKIAKEKWLEARLRRIWQNRKKLQQANNENNRTIVQRSEMTIQCIPEVV
jgi:hypothetical protein